MTLLPWRFHRSTAQGSNSRGWITSASGCWCSRPSRPILDKVAKTNIALAPKPVDFDSEGAARLALLRQCPHGSFELADPDGTLIDVGGGALSRLDHPKRLTGKPARRTTPSRASCTRRSTRDVHANQIAAPLLHLTGDEHGVDVARVHQVHHRPGRVVERPDVEPVGRSMTMSASFPGSACRPCVEVGAAGALDGGELEHVAAGEQRRQVLLAARARAGA